MVDGVSKGLLGSGEAGQDRWALPLVQDPPDRVLRPSAASRCGGHMVRTIRPKHYRRLIVVGVVALALVACSSDGEAAPETTTTTASTTSTTSTTVATTTTLSRREQQEIEILDAYRAAATAFSEAGDPPDPNHPALAATHVGVMLDHRQQVLMARRHEGLAARRPENSVRRIELIDGTMEINDEIAIFEICDINDGQLVPVDGGQPDDRVWSEHWRVAMEPADGTWLLAEAFEVEVVEGVGGCAEGW